MSKRHSKDWVKQFNWFTTSKGQHIGVERGGNKMVAPKWYKLGQNNPSKNQCPHCGRGLKKGYCGEHGKIK